MKLLLTLFIFYLISRTYSQTTGRAREPQIISHRGASGYVPEHSLPGMIKIS